MNSHSFGSDKNYFLERLYLIDSLLKKHSLDTSDIDEIQGLVNNMLEVIQFRLGENPLGSLDNNNQDIIASYTQLKSACNGLFSFAESIRTSLLLQQRKIDVPLLPDLLHSIKEQSNQVKRFVNRL